MANCEYCRKENAGNGNVLDGTTCDFGETNFDIDLSMWYGCSDSPSLDILVTIGSETIAKTTTKINYCPMCGRKLESEEQCNTK